MSVVKKFILKLFCGKFEEIYLRQTVIYCSRRKKVGQRILKLTSYSPSPSPDALRNQWPAHWSDMTLFEWSLVLLS